MTRRIRPADSVRIMESDDYPDKDRAQHCVAILNHEGELQSVATVASRLGWDASRARMALSAAEERGMINRGPR